MLKIDRSILPWVKAALKSCPHLQLEVGSRHTKLRNTESCDFIILPGSLSDYRGTQNCKQAIKKLAVHKQGLIYWKQTSLHS